MPAGKLTYLANGNCTGRIDYVADLSQNARSRSTQRIVYLRFKTDQSNLGDN